jgi:hypothetical protein
MEGELTPPILLRLVLVILGLVIWYATQSLLRNRPSGAGHLGDGLHALTAPVYRFFATHARRADLLLILSSLLIDGVGCFVLGYSVLGPSFRPFLGLFILFISRQICQALCALPPPEGMIWRYPGFPSLLVTYHVSNDLFFSGHTALAVYGALELGAWGGTGWAVAGAALATFEIAVVIVLRAHYTMDVFAGAVAAFAAWVVAGWLAPTVDQWLIQFAAMMGSALDR